MVVQESLTWAQTAKATAIMRVHAERMATLGSNSCKARKHGSSISTHDPERSTDDKKNDVLTRCSLKYRALATGVGSLTRGDAEKRLER